MSEKLNKPFGNESEIISMGGMAVENRTDAIAIYGSMDITPDSDGLAKAKALRVILHGIESEIISRMTGGPPK